MSDGATMVIVVCAMAAVGWVALKILGAVFSKGWDVAEHVTKGVAGKAKEVAASASHSVSLLALRGQTHKLVKMGLEVADQHSGLNELSLDADLSRKNDELAGKIVGRAFNRLSDQFHADFPEAALVATNALLHVASELGPGEMREKTRVAGQAVGMLINKELAETTHLSRLLLMEISAFVAHLDTASLAEAFEKA